MGETFSEEDWKACISILEKSVIPDHAKGIVELIKVLKKEIEYVNSRFKDLSPDAWGYS